VQHAIDAAAGGGVDEVVVVLGARADLIEPRLSLPPNARAIRNPDFAAGQSASLRAGILAVAGEAAAVVVLLADQPGVTARDVRDVVAAWRATGSPIVRASYRGSPGHPILLARGLFGELLAVAGDRGARDILGAHPGLIHEVPMDREPPGDVDTRDDLAAMGGGGSGSNADVSPPGTSG
jgi:CTP:molybdopterin cytidylyltransferase MocA